MDTVDLAETADVARSLLNAVIVDAAGRGRDRVGLEVDADSPTGAVDLYTSTGFCTSFITQSWHRDLQVGKAARSTHASCRRSRRPE